MERKQGIAGFVTAYLTGENGNKKKVFEGKNTINAEFYNALALHLDTNTDFALDNLFTTDVVEQYHDGIAFLSLNPSTSAFIEHLAMVSTTSEPAAQSFRCTGVYTNSSGATIRVSLPNMGKSWVGAASANASGFNDFYISTDVGWSALDVPTGTALTIVWTITFTEH